MPKVSVIIPVHNTEKYLTKCLESVYNQTLTDIEIICINDCSTDNSLGILQEYAENDRRIKLIDFKENKGAAAARNAGIDAAAGEYIGFVDSDDFIGLDFYEKLYKKAVETNSDVVKGNIYDCDQFGESPKLTFFYDRNEKIRENKAYFCYGFTSAIYKLNLLQQHKIRFPENISHFEDPYFSIQIAVYLNTISFVESARYFYIRHLNSAVSTSKNFTKAQDFINAVYLIYEFLNQANLTEKDYFIYLSFLYWQVEPWCYDISLPAGANLIAQESLIAMLNNKYGMDKFIKFYFSEKMSFIRLNIKKDKKNVIEMLRNKVKKHG